MVLCGEGGAGTGILRFFWRRIMKNSDRATRSDIVATTIPETAAVESSGSLLDSRGMIS
jgi:hypothetical protein